MMRAGLISLILAALSARAGAVDFSLEYLSVPAVNQFVQEDASTLKSWQSSKDISLPTIGLRVAQSLPQLFSDWPLSIGFETGFGLPAGTSSFDERQLKINSSSLSANARNEGDAIEYSVLSVPIMATIGYVPRFSGINIGGQLGVGVVMMDVREDLIDSVYVSTLNDLDYVTTTHNHLSGTAFAVQLSGGLIVPVTETLSARLWGGAMWMSEADFSSVKRQADGTSIVEGLQVGGIGYTVRVGLSSTL